MSKLCGFTFFIGVSDAFSLMVFACFAATFCALIGGFSANILVRCVFLSSAFGVPLTSLPGYYFATLSLDLSLSDFKLVF
jgi:hypothetical protein